MIKRKRKRNPLKDDKKLMRKVAELLAKAIEKQPDGITAYLLAAELVRRDSLYCEECQNYDIEKDCDWSICYPEIDELLEESTLDMAKEAAEELAEDLGIVDYVKVFRYIIQNKRYRYISDIDDNYILKNVSLSEMDLSEMDLSTMNLSGSNLSGADLSYTLLRFADLYMVDLTGADLTGADLTGADLTGADLSEANLYRANLYRTNLSRADFTNAKITNSTYFTNSRNEEEAINLTISNPRKVIANAKKKSNKTKTSERNIKRSR